MNALSLAFACYWALSPFCAAVLEHELATATWLQLAKLRPEVERVVNEAQARCDREPAKPCREFNPLNRVEVHYDAYREASEELRMAHRGYIATHRHYHDLQQRYPLPSQQDLPELNDAKYQRDFRSINLQSITRDCSSRLEQHLGELRHLLRLSMRIIEQSEGVALAKIRVLPPIPVAQQVGLTGGYPPPAATLDLFPPSAPPATERDSSPTGESIEKYPSSTGERLE